MTHIKALIAATAISTGFALALPAVSEAMPAGPVKIQATSDSNIVNVTHKKKWSKKWARYCRYHDDWRCYRYRHARIYRYRYYDPYVYDPYPYYGYYRRDYGPGIGLQFRID